MMENKKIENGMIIKVLGGIYTVATKDKIIDCKARGIFRNKGISPMSGDRVEIETIDNTSVITKIHERRNSIIRPPLANLDMLVFVISTCEPVPNFSLLDKFIAIATYKGIEPLIVITKIDLENSKRIIDVYSKVGIDIIKVNNEDGSGSSEVAEKVKGKFCAFTGNTGVGKSSLLNNIFPQMNLQTNEISKKLGRGKHTTRHVEIYKYDENTYIADTPGFSSFETNKYDIIRKEELASCFVEFAPFVDKCKYMDCSHTKEDGCAVLEAVRNGIISESRHNSYVEMYEEAKQLKEWEIKKR